MYSQQGMGAIDWGQILGTGIQTVGSILTSRTGPSGSGTSYPPTGYPGIPPTTPEKPFDWTTVALVGVGVFLLVRMMK